MPEAPAVTTATSSAAQETPKADSAASKTPSQVTTQAAPTPAATPSPAPEPAKAEVKESAKPAAEPAKVGVKADANAAKEAPKAEVVYDIQIAEGAAITKDDLGGVISFAKEQGYSNDQAFAIASYLDQVKVQNAALTDKQWVEECQAHPKYGKENYGKTSEMVKRHLERVAPKLIPLLESSRFGNNPVVWEYLAEQASRGADDTLVSGKQAVVQDTRSTMQRIADEFNKSLGVTK